MSSGITVSLCLLARHLQTRFMIERSTCLRPCISGSTRQESVAESESYRPDQATVGRMVSTHVSERTCVTIGRVIVHHQERGPRKPLTNSLVRLRCRPQGKASTQSTAGHVRHRARRRSGPERAIGRDMRRRRPFPDPSKTSQARSEEARVTMSAFRLNSSQPLAAGI